MFILHLLQIIWYFFTRRLNRKTEAFLSELVDIYTRFTSYMNENYVSHSEMEQVKEKWQPYYNHMNTLWIPKSHRYYGQVQSFRNLYIHLDETVASKNKEFVTAEKERFRTLLSNIDGKSLDDQQRTAVVTGEDANLVLAGAGSGKTLTIAGKVKYLCQAKKIKPEDILLIAFTRKSAEEMQERIGKKLGIHIDTYTFHKLGLRIIAESRNEKPDVDDNLDRFVGRYLTETIIRKPEEIKRLIKYFAYYLKIPANLENFDSLGEAYDYERGADLETLQSKYEQAKYLEREKESNAALRETLKHERVKSLDEVEIANYLFLNGVNYIYEVRYPFPTSDAVHRQYHPDFYLPDYDIYIEHFGIDRKGNLPWLSEIEAEKYKESIKWKRETHAQNGTKLLETYSYYSSEGRLLTELESMLLKNGVEFHEPDFKEIFDAIYSEAGEKYYSEFITLCKTFITLFKSRGYRVEELSNLKYPKGQPLTSFHKERTQLFLDIIRPILNAYNNYLADEHAVDFSDMINQATDIVRNGYMVHKYKWIIIDEYQDISVARFNLIKAIIDQVGAKLLCVGDDWQSIYRFTGSDISLFTRFEKYFPYNEIMKIEQTYRNSQELIDIAGAFIMKNGSQYRKDLRSGKHTEIPLVFMCYMDYSAEIIQNAIDRILHDEGAYKSIMLLGRTRHDAEPLRNSPLFYLNENTGEVAYVAAPETKITFLTVHKAKGLEADNVILMNFKNDILGFPNKITDDPLLSLVLTDSEEYMYAEERRLLYVALTRTRNRTYVLVNDVIPSEFYKEFLVYDNVEITHDDPQYARTYVECPRCKTGHLVLRKNSANSSDFLGCSNYPKCDYTVKDTSILLEHRRCPDCGGFLVKRKAYSEFYGCSNYPRCCHTESI